MQAEPLTLISQQTLTLVGLAMEHGRDHLPPRSPAVAAKIDAKPVGKAAVKSDTGTKSTDLSEEEDPV